MAGFNSGGAKTDNHEATKAAKIKIRKNVLAAVTPDKARVFDAFAGTGNMYRDVWKDAAGYVGCDKRYFPDERTAFVSDNIRVLRAIDLTPFTVFDLDAYGSPWEQALIVANRRKLKKGERIGLVLTEGSGLAIKANSLPKVLSLLSGVRTGMTGYIRIHGTLIDRALAGIATRMGGKIVSRWEAKGRTGAVVRYIGLVIEKQ